MKMIDRLTIVGAGCLELAALDEIRSAGKVLVRDGISTAWLAAQGVSKVQRMAPAPGQSLDAWWADASAGLADGGSVVYVTSISPVGIDQVAKLLRTSLQVGEARIFSGADLLPSLLCSHPDLDFSALLSLDGLRLVGQHHPPFAPAQPVLLFTPCQAISRGALLTLLTQVYPERHTVFVVEEGGELKHLWKEFALNEISRSEKPIAALFIPPMAADTSLESFQEVIAHLRAPEDGCPWDRKQTHTSLRTYLLEETYEALDALDKNDINGIQEELGDILLQILLHAQIAVENGEFTLADVLSGINRKIVYRHPHVFDTWKVSGVSDVVQNWEALKDQERQKNGADEKKGMLDGVPLSFPALAQAQAIQDRAARVGFDWGEIQPVWDKIFEELDEVRSAPDDGQLAGELGDLLFAVVNLVRWNKVDAESVLRQTNLKFRKRFAFIEEQARTTGKDLSKMTLEEMDHFWEQAKDFDD